MKPPPPGDWITPRQNRQLTGVQPLPGRMRRAPRIAASIDLGRGRGALTPIDDDRVVEIADGVLRCWTRAGVRLWESHPPGLNFESLTAARDLDGDGRVELALMAGRPTAPYGAAVVVDADTGKVRFRHDVEPMSYWWTLQAGRFLPDSPGEQLVVCEHGYPPDARFGYIALFDFPSPGKPARTRWRFDFDAYTCFPSLLVADIDGDGVEELCVETHSRMWVLDTRTGKPRQFLEWDVAPANVRSYGLVRFQDLDGDGRPDFFCIANFAQHHEVLRNEKGRLVRAWAHGWDDSVTTAKVATAYPDPPIADVDGDGRLEMVLSMFHADTEARWCVRVYDAATGVLKARVPDRVAVALCDLDGDGRAEIVADVCTDPTRATTSGAAVLAWRGDALAEIWKDPAAQAIAPPPPGGRPAPRRGGLARHTEYPLPDAVWARRGGKTLRLRADSGAVRLADETPPAPPAPPDLGRIPATVGPAIAPPLAADLDGDGRHELIHRHAGVVTVYRCDGARLLPIAAIPSDADPVVADVDGDGRRELVVGRVSPTADPVVEVWRIGREASLLWRAQPPRPAREGLPFGARMYLQAGRFLGRGGDDLYVYAGTPIVRSMVLRGADGALVWDRGDAPGIERYFAPTVNQASVWDFDGDGCDDLVFTNPDYVCVASGPTGAALLGPLFPPKIFSQPSQGLYTFPALLPRAGADPLVCLVGGHYFIGTMDLRARPLWHRLPPVGEARAGAEGFLQAPDGTWRMGIGRQDGRFACVDVATGKTLWTIDLGATPSDVVACDVDGDGQTEFVVGTSHGHLVALGERDGRARRVWSARLGSRVGTPTIADVDGDGVSEIVVGLGDGRLAVLRPEPGRA